MTFDNQRQVCTQRNVRITHRIPHKTSSLFPSLCDTSGSSLRFPQSSNRSLENAEQKWSSTPIVSSTDGNGCVRPTVAGDCRLIWNRVAVVCGIQPFVSTVHEAEVCATVKHVEIHRTVLLAQYPSQHLLEFCCGKMDNHNNQATGTVVIQFCSRGHNFRLDSQVPGEAQCQAYPRAAKLRVWFPSGQTSLTRTP